MISVVSHVPLAPKASIIPLDHAAFTLEGCNTCEKHCVDLQLIPLADFQYIYLWNILAWAQPWMSILAGEYNSVMT